MSTKPALGESAEIPQILHALDQGTVLIRFFKKKANRPEKRIFCLKTDTFEILQFPMTRGSLTLPDERSKQGVIIQASQKPCVCLLVGLHYLLVLYIVMCFLDAHVHHNTVDIREVKMVREGTDSRDFERQTVGLRMIDQFCFIVYYGSEFRLKTLSVAGRHTHTHCTP